MKRHTHSRHICSRHQGSKARQLSSSAAAALVALVLVAGCTGTADVQSRAVDDGAETTVSSQPTTTGPAPQAGALDDEGTSGDDADVTAQASPSEPEDSAEDEAVEAVVITITDFTFDVPDKIAPGTEVTIRNEDRVGHTVTSDEEGLFDVLVGGGQEATFTVPDQPGEYSFFCKPHPNMVATLVVG